MVVDAMHKLGQLADHLDTRDPRPVFTTNRPDPTNFWLAAKHVAALAKLLRANRGCGVYLPLSQVKWGFLRDAAFIGVATAFRRRVIVHLNGGAFQRFFRESGPLMRRIIALTMRQVDEGWVLTPAHRGMFEGLLPDCRVNVLENAVPDIDPPARRNHDAAGRPLRILYLSNLVPEKGWRELLDALEALAKALPRPAFEARLAGAADPDVAAEVRRRAADLSTRGIPVTYDGVVSGDAKGEIFAWADLFVLPTRYPLEGQPLCLLEAMAAGLPIISTDHSGIPSTVRDDVEGLIIPVGDAPALADAIARLAGDRDLRARLGAAGRRRYEERYSPEAFRAALGAVLVASNART